MVSKNVLVVDDNTFIVRMLTSKLIRAGYTVGSASDGLESLEVARQQRPSLVLMDWLMPRMDGIEATRRFKGDPELAHIPILMLTCKGQEDDEEVAIKAGVERYITKPFHIDSLMALVEEMLL